MHGAASAYIAEMLQLRGPSLAMTDFENSFEQAIVLAQCWLASGACDCVLVGAVEELGDVLLHCAGRMLEGEQNLGEGAVFVVLGKGEGIARIDATAPLPREAGLWIYDEPIVGEGVEGLSDKAVSVSRHFGRTGSMGAFQTLYGLLAINAGRVDNVAIVRPICGLRGVDDAAEPKFLKDQEPISNGGCIDA